MNNTQKMPSNVPLYVIGLWFLAAILEGIDLQSAGIAGPGIAAEFHFNSAQMGWIFTAGTLGLVLGAISGGKLADRHGRRIILIVSVVIYGVFSLATAHGWNLPSMLTFRLLTGFGLGGAIPNLIALVAESTAPRNRNTIIGLMYCGMPLGSALIAALGWFGLDDFGWRVIFYAGGIAPLIIAPLFILALPESPQFAIGHRATNTATGVTLSNQAVLFGEQRWSATLALWLSSFCTYFVLYLLINWLPSLLLNKGFSSRSASAVMILFNLGGMFGILAGGALMDRFRYRHVIVAIYGCLLVALLGLSYAGGVVAILVAAFAADFFVASSQMIQYCLAPNCYPAAQRGTAVGAMVAVGRTGSIVGPFTAGQLLASGAAASVVLSAGIPGLCVSALALLLTYASASQRKLSA